MVSAMREPPQGAVNTFSVVLLCFVAIPTQKLKLISSVSIFEIEENIKKMTVSSSCFLSVVKTITLDMIYSKKPFFLNPTTRALPTQHKNNFIPFVSIGIGFPCYATVIKTPCMTTTFAFEHSYTPVYEIPTRAGSSFLNGDKPVRIIP